MEDLVRSIYCGGVGEIIEKKSRFIATVVAVSTKQEAEEFIAACKKKYWDAKHNCSAYIISQEIELVHCSDDGEPSGTAGKPMLEILKSEQLVNVCVVVTRYFGGVLLGTGGLVRAYTDATKAGLSQCQIAIIKHGKRVKIHTDYNTIGKILFELGQRGLNPEDSEYTDVIVLTVIVLVEDIDGFLKKITEISAGKTTVEVIEDVHFEKVE